ncbi:MAG TPA: TetR/AcrR family transcriptional regulator [Ktedonobacterales bacterium]|nr:TetR/AcrR family transcriptional regulator [Ktedonobacterales bacterium]
MPREDNSEERRNQILEAALNVFARKGFDEARMEDIATESGVSKGGLYLYYKSKDALIEALLRSMFSVELHGMQARLAKGESATARIQSLTHTMTSLMERMSVVAPVMLEFYAIAARRESVRVFLSDALQQFRDVFAEIIRDGIARGEFRGVNADAAAISLIALYEGMALLWFMTPRAIPKGYGEEAVSLFLVGLNAPTTP